MSDLKVIPDLNVECSGLFQVKQVKGGTYNNVTLTAKSSGSIHVNGTLIVKGKLTIVADHSGTVLARAKVVCDTLDLTSTYSSNINTNDLEVASFCKVTASRASTTSLYMVLSGPLNGSVSASSTVNTWINWPHGKKDVDVSVDGSSVFSERDWNGPN